MRPGRTRRLLRQHPSRRPWRCVRVLRVTCVLGSLDSGPKRGGTVERRLVPDFVQVKTVYLRGPEVLGSRLAAAPGLRKVAGVRQRTKNEAAQLVVGLAGGQSRPPQQGSALDSFDQHADRLADKFCVQLTEFACRYPLLDHGINATCGNSRVVIVDVSRDGIGHHVRVAVLGHPAHFTADAGQISRYAVPWIGDFSDPRLYPPCRFPEELLDDHHYYFVPARGDAVEGRFRASESRHQRLDRVVREPLAQEQLLQLHQNGGAPVACDISAGVPAHVATLERGHAASIRIQPGASAARSVVTRGHGTIVPYFVPKLPRPSAQNG